MMMHMLQLWQIYNEKWSAIPTILWIALQRIKALHSSSKKKCQPSFLHNDNLKNNSAKKIVDLRLLSSPPLMFCCRC